MFLKAKYIVVNVCDMRPHGITTLPPREQERRKSLSMPIESRWCRSQPSPANYGMVTIQ
jgi:hypothetical protein